MGRSLLSKKSTLTSLLAIFLLTMHLSPGWAEPPVKGGVGSGGTGGGDTIECDNGPILADSEGGLLPDSYFLQYHERRSVIERTDYFKWYLEQPKLKGIAQESSKALALAYQLLSTLRDGSEEEQIVSDRLSRIIFGGYEKRKYQVPILEFKFVDDLPELDDDGIQFSFYEKLIGCEKKQLAIQNLQTGEVLVHRRRFHELKEHSQAMLLIHEAFVHDYKAGNETTEKVRAMVSRYFGSIPFTDRVIESEIRNFKGWHRTIELEKRRFAVIGFVEGGPEMFYHKKGNVRDIEWFTWSSYIHYGFPPVDKEVWDRVRWLKPNNPAGVCDKDDVNSLIECWGWRFAYTRVNRLKTNECSGLGCLFNPKELELVEGETP